MDLSDLLKVLAARIEDFKDLLVVPRSVVGGVNRRLLTLGKHCSDMNATTLTNTMRNVLINVLLVQQS